MKITFYSNFLNHHQTPFCDEMVKHFGVEFTFVSSETVPEERIRIGYQDCTHYVYNLTAYANEANYRKALQLGIDSDIVIIGSAPDIFIEERLRQNKHTFRYSERYLKRGHWQLLNPRVLCYLYRHDTKYRSKNLYMLCASGYTANDLSWVFGYPKKKYKWGYFTEVKELDIEQTIAHKPAERIELLWVGRFLDWKHPELAVQLAFELKKRGYNFYLYMIGTGEMAGYIQNLIITMNVADCVSIAGGIPNSEVRNYMQNAHIFLFTSDRNEGWGAVLNEAMSSGCAVIASHTIGSVPFLIKHKQNGLVFESENLTSLLQQTEKLILNKVLREKLSKDGYYTIKNEWSPKNAVANFMRLVKSILNGQKITIESGPCSLAENTPKRFWQKEIA
jgi:glycosyltransferase involved in cell wall biosynthesis